MTTKLIDLSHHNTVLDWNKVKGACDGVILRVAYRGYGSGRIVADNKFSEFASRCTRLSIPWGIYFMSSAITLNEAIEEADYSIKQARAYGMPRNMPIFIDTEDVDGTPAVRRSDGLSKPARTSIVKMFVDRINQSEFKGGIYCSESWTRDKLNWSDVANVGINWLAKYSKNNNGNNTIYVKPCHIHQFTSSGAIAGVKGDCDVSNCFIDLGLEKTPVPAETGAHIPLNYKAGNKYTVVVSALNVRRKPTLNNGSIVMGEKLGSLKAGDIVENGATMQMNEQIWMYIGLKKGIEQWICADTGAKAYVK